MDTCGGVMVGSSFPVGVSGLNPVKNETHLFTQALVCLCDNRYCDLLFLFSILNGSVYTGTDIYCLHCLKSKSTREFYIRLTSSET